MFWLMTMATCLRRKACRPMSIGCESTGSKSAVSATGYDQHCEVDDICGSRGSSQLVFKTKPCKSSLTSLLVNHYWLCLNGQVQWMTHNDIRFDPENSWGLGLCNLYSILVMCLMELLFLACLVLGATCWKSSWTLRGGNVGEAQWPLRFPGGRDWKRLEGSFLIFLRFLLHVVVGFAPGVCFSHIDVCFPSPKSIPCSHAILVFAMPWIGAAVEVEDYAEARKLCSGGRYAASH